MRRKKGQAWESRASRNLGNRIVFHESMFIKCATHFERREMIRGSMNMHCCRQVATFRFRKVQIEGYVGQWLHWDSLSPDFFRQKAKADPSRSLLRRLGTVLEPSTYPWPVMVVRMLFLSSLFSRPINAGIPAEVGLLLSSPLSFSSLPSLKKEVAWVEGDTGVKTVECVLAPLVAILFRS